MHLTFYDVIIIGAGPSGTVAASILAQKGYRVAIIESSQFPRFSIGESLLPQAMEFLQSANLLGVVENAGFQFKNGAAFCHKDTYTDFDFSQKSCPGFNTTFQVERATFDKLLADEAQNYGVEIHYQQRVTEVAFGDNIHQLKAVDTNYNSHTYQTRFILDASGFSRILPNLLNLNRPSEFPPRKSIFTHIHTSVDQSLFDQNKILITTHPQQQDIWFWLIPLSNKKYSIGVVGEPGLLGNESLSNEQQLLALLQLAPNLKRILSNVQFTTPVRNITGYAQDVTSLYGHGYALLGNAGEFLDPIFSSGVTIALKSAVLAANALDKTLSNQTVDWQTEFAEPLQQWVNTFKCYVRAWYNGNLQKIIYSKTQPPEIKAKICSILAGYAWDKSNDYAVDAKHKLNILAKVCESLNVS